MVKKGWMMVGLLLATYGVIAQKERSRKLYVEVEPLQFASSGFSVVGHYALTNRWHIGTNVFRSELSAGFNDLVFDQDGPIDLLATQNLGINVSVRYFLQKEKGGKGWVASLPIGYENWTLNDQNTSLEEDYNFWYLSPRVGYLWYPLKKERFYLLAEAVAIVPIATSGETSIGPSSVNINPVIPLPGLGLGFRF